MFVIVALVKRLYKVFTVSDNLFNLLPLTTAMLDNLQSIGYKIMTPVQAQGLPIILQGEDLIAQAKTGSGKTAAFGIGLLHKLSTAQLATQALVICPTRELSEQVCNELRRLARALPNTKIVSLCGGKPMAGQLASLKRSPHIVVGTPGRLLKHLTKGSLKLDALKTLVLDEADRMLDMGFIDEINLIVKQTPNERQTLLFSATFPSEIKAISQSVQNNPADIRVENTKQHSDIEQVFYQVEADQKNDCLLKIISYYKPSSAVVFCNRKQQCDLVARSLINNGISAKALHGDLDQNERDRVLTQFTNQSCSILVATDVAARGLDIKELPLVINYELSTDAEVHIHRVGRTGRAGTKGYAISRYMPSESAKIVEIEKQSQQKFKTKPIAELNTTKPFIPKPSMTTLAISGGRKDKLRAGDVLGALTAHSKIDGNHIGKIDRFDRVTFVAVDSGILNEALDQLNGKIKGRVFRTRHVK
ncbi:MAG: ATP-dependent RNA helicase DbpA [Kangiellaceae bacterium]|jgi:ATP-independent RNA helicase DbpA|nr:ATP-dependent RNA helicase DbpA [Kangiellaceae bacterium]